MRPFKSVLLICGALLLNPVLPADAHHSFASEFDANRPIILVGKVKRMVFSNPHSFIYLDVALDSGEVQEWAIEGAAPNALLRRGWNRASLPAGTEVTVKGFQARDRSNWCVKRFQGIQSWPGDSSMRFFTQAQ